MTQKTGNIIFSILLILAATVLIYQATGFRGSGVVASSELGSGVFPIVILSFTIVCCLVNIFQNLYLKADGREKKKIPLDRTQFIRVTLVFVACLVSYFAWERFGFLVMTTLFMISVAIILGVRSIRIWLLLLGFGPIVYFIFDRALHIML